MDNSFEIYHNETKIGKMKVYAIGKNETYYFSYDENWIKNGFEIDPNLPLKDTEFISKDLWGVFCDISPDRWGRLIQKRKAGSELTNSEYLIGVSDYFRIGSIRIKKGDEFVSSKTNVPKLTSINELCASAYRIEQGESLDSDIKNLLAPSGSLGGARPKASIIKNNELYIAKFPSMKDEYRQISNCEQTMLEVAKVAKINVCEAELYETMKGTALLVKRFDRASDKRIPYKSAMTLLGVKDGETNNEKSYIDLAFMLDSKNKKELFRRMVFNGLFGNTDDHLRNHGVLYDENTKTWNLSPAFDITPETISYSKQNHALNFIDFVNLPSVELFDEIKDFFDINEKEFEEILSDMLIARDEFEKIAKKNGINSDNLKMLKNNYEHEDFEKIRGIVKRYDIEETFGIKMDSIDPNDTTAMDKIKAKYKSENSNVDTDKNDGNKPRNKNRNRMY